MFKSIISAALYWPLIFALRVTLILLGIPVVALALLFARGRGEVVPFTQFSGLWDLVELPVWAWPWSNLRDGAMGDKRGWYWTVGYPQIFDRLPPGPCNYMKMWWWLVARNPANNFSRFTRGIACNADISTIWLIAGQDYVADDPGHEGWQFVGGDGPVFRYWGFYYVSKRKFFGRSLVIRLGHKIEPRHNTTDWSQDPQKAWKGITFRIGFKEL